MKQKLNPKKYNAKAEKVYEEALEATVALLKANGEKRYIVIPGSEDSVSAHDVYIYYDFWGVGLNDENHICVQYLKETYDGAMTDEYSEPWADITTDLPIEPSAYPDLYRFVADHLEEAIDKETAYKVKREGWWYDEKKGKVVFLDGTTSIVDYAFDSCDELTNIEIPSSVTKIGSGAFCGCKGLSTIVIPNSVTEIEPSAFRDCSGLTNIVIPDSVKEIGWDAFNGCKRLVSIEFPKAIKVIADDALDNCTALQQIIVSAGSSEKFKKMLDEKLHHLIVEKSE